MAEPVKTVVHDGDVGAFVAGIEHAVRRRDAGTMVELMTAVTGQPARMWGPAIIGFGTYHYVYDSGREGDTAAIGFSPRKAATTVYLMDGPDAYPELLGRLGPHTTGKSCLYLKDLATVDLDVLTEMVRQSYLATTGRS